MLNVSTGNPRHANGLNGQLGSSCVSHRSVVQVAGAASVNQACFPRRGGAGGRMELRVRATGSS